MIALGTHEVIELYIDMWGTRDRERTERNRTSGTGLTEREQKRGANTTAKISRQSFPFPALRLIQVALSKRSVIVLTKVS